MANGLVGRRRPIQRFGRQRKHRWRRISLGNGSIILTPLPASATQARHCQDHVFANGTRRPRGRPGRRLPSRALLQPSGGRAEAVALKCLPNCLPPLKKLMRPLSFGSSARLYPSCVINKGVSSAPSRARPGADQGRQRLSAGQHPVGCDRRRDRGELSPIDPLNEEGGPQGRLCRLQSQRLRLETAAPAKISLSFSSELPA